MGKDSVTVLDRLRIFEMRGQTVVLDSDLAAVYGVTTGNFNKAVGRNLERFPEDFTFILSPDEFEALIFQIGTSKGRGGRRKVPRVFTEHGAIMAATILNRNGLRRNSNPDGVSRVREGLSESQHSKSL